MAIQRRPSIEGRDVVPANDDRNFADIDGLERVENVEVSPPSIYDICSDCLAFLYSWSPVKVEPSDLSYGDEMYYVLNVPFFSLMFITIILLVSLLPPSFHYIDYDTYGLLRNNYGDVHLTPTYGPGRYFQPLSFSYVEFPATYQAVEMSTAVFLDNGMEFDLTVRFYYRIPKDHVGVIYDTFSNSYNSRIEGNAKNQIKLQDYLNNRSVVEAAIGGNVSQTVFKVAGVEAPPEYCLILDIKFPDILVDSSLNSAIALQQNELNLIEQRVQLVQSETAQLVASIESQQVLLLESAENVAQQLVETAEAQASSIVNTARAIGIGNMFKALNITNPEEKDALLKAMAIFDNDHGNHTVMYEVLAGSLVNVN